MNDAELGGVIRALRHRRGWRQTDLAAKAGVSASLISLLERGSASSLSVHGLRRIGSALDLRLTWDAGYRGAELARLRDADHARLAEWLTQRLDAFGWTVVALPDRNAVGVRRAGRQRVHLQAGALSTTGLGDRAQKPPKPA
jgi:transcriptional regulator with XRE-family HTH domain